MAELPPNERPPQQENIPLQTFLWAAAGFIILAAIAAGAVIGFAGGTIVSLRVTATPTVTALRTPTITPSSTPWPTPVPQQQGGQNSIEEARLGVYYRTIATPDDQERFQQEGGAMIVRVISGGPADDARLGSGDIIVQVGATPLTGDVTLSSALSRFSAGQSISLRVIIAGEENIVEVILGR
ncbi:MAG: PDZ domain-containing protein [Anaerolineae bacterium]